jgi:hypothetical protein
MAENNQSREIRTGGPSYVGWRGELLAELALTRVPELSVHKPKEACGYDFLVATSSGVCFFVLVRAFSSKNQNIRAIDQLADWRWRVRTDFIVHAQESPSPVFMFLIDADTEHGRYLRLDTLEVRNKSAQAQTIRFPRDNTIDKRGIQALVAALEKCEKVESH